ncbi:MAG: FAD:protein FMN transferase [Balneolaceae bacterium]|nr:FAD:protein FMN transferase [Balneolaceae bacterium]
MLLLLLLFLLLPSPLTGQELQRFEYDSPHMGTTFRILMYAESEQIADSASQAAFSKVEELNEIMSDYDPKSELSLLSDRAPTEQAVQVSDPLFHVLNRSQQIAHKTGGAFDVTVGPYVELWRRMNRQPEPKLPPQDTLLAYAERVSYRYLELNPQQKTVKLTRPGMQLDLGGIAKGYAADQVLEVLNNYGIYSALVDAGGDIVLGDSPPDRKGWNIEVLTHDTQGIEDEIMLQLSNKAVATSGDLFQYVEIEGTRYSHIIDPRTGLGLTDRRQVTVIASSGIMADGYASAMSVMKPEKAVLLAEELPDLSVFIEQSAADGIKRWRSQSFKKLLKTN